MAGRTTRYYRKNRAALKVKAKYQKKYDARKSSKDKRVALTRINRRMKRSGKGKKGDGLDVSHRKNGKTFLEKASKNRARNRSRK